MHSDPYVPRQPVAGVLAATAASIGVPIVLLVLASLPMGSESEGDAYVRGILGTLVMLPLLALCFGTYHTLVTVASFYVRIGPLYQIGLIPALGSLVSAATIMATGAPLSWSRMDDLLSFSAMLWAPIATGSVAHYFISFRPVRTRRSS